MNPLLLTVACHLACFSTVLSFNSFDSKSSYHNSWSARWSPTRTATGSIRDPCPKWNAWNESETCVMPNELASAVNTECPAHPSDHRRRSLDGVTLSFGFYGRTPSWGKLKHMGHLDERIDWPGQQSRGTPKQTVATPWESIYTKCGSCGIKFRCKTRKPSYGCSPSLEVERTPCMEADGKAACQLGPQQCSQVDKNLWDNNTVLALKRSLRTRSSYSSNRFRSINEAAWTPITGFEDVFYGNNGNQKSRFRSLDSMPMPTMNCVKSWRGCTCCCKPFVPLDGVCRDATAAIADLPKPPKFVPAVEEKQAVSQIPLFTTSVPLASEFVKEPATGPSHSGSNDTQANATAMAETHGNLTEMETMHHGNRMETEIPLALPFPTIVPLASDVILKPITGPGHFHSNETQANATAAAETHGNIIETETTHRGNHTETEAPPFPTVNPILPDFMEQHKNKSSSEVQIGTRSSSSRKRTSKTQTVL